MRITTLIITLLITCQSFATVVRFETNVGNIDIELYEDVAPVTVANFLTYVNDGDYDDTVIHRSVPGFVIQGGGYRYLGSNNFEDVPNNSPIVNESQLSNSEGTISMARLTDPNSATNEWFINLVNNPGLDAGGGEAGFAVFGKVIRGMDVVKLIESFLRINFSSSNIGGAASTFPIYGFFSGTAVTLENTVKISRAYVLSETFQITEGLSGAWFNPATSGQGVYFEVLPAAGVIVMAWFTFDNEDPDAAVPSTVGDASNRWLTASGSFQGNQFIGTVFKTSGFDAAKPM